MEKNKIKIEMCESERDIREARIRHQRSGEIRREEEGVRRRGREEGRRG